MKNGVLTEMEFPRIEFERRPRKASLPTHDVSEEIHEEKMEEVHDELPEMIMTENDELPETIMASDLFDSPESLQNESDTPESLQNKSDKRIDINLGDYFAGIQSHVRSEAKTVFMPKIFWYSK